MSSNMGSSGEIFYQHSGNSFQSFQPSSNNVLGIHDPPITGKTSTEYGNIAASITEAKEESQAGEVSSMRTNPLIQVY